MLVHPPPLFSWEAVGVLLKIPEGGGVFQERGGGGPGVRTGNLGAGGGGAEAPFTAKTSPLSGENAF